MKNSIVLKVFLVLCIYVFLNSLFLGNIYGTVIVKDSNIYEENVDVNILVSNMFNEILKLPDGEDLEYNFKINFIMQKMTIDFLDNNTLDEVKKVCDKFEDGIKITRIG